MPGLKLMRKSVKTFCFSSHVSSWHHSPPQFSASFLPTNPSFTNLSFCLSSSSCPLRACYRMPDTWWNDVKKNNCTNTHADFIFLSRILKISQHFLPRNLQKKTSKRYAIWHPCRLIFQIWCAQLARGKRGKKQNQIIATYIYIESTQHSGIRKVSYSLDFWKKEKAPWKTEN